MSNNAQHIRYAILLNRVPNKETSPESIKKHVEHLRQLELKGKLVLCGPFIDHRSGMVVVKAEDKSEAIAIAESDPFITDGLSTFEVRTWLLANAENNYLA